MNIVSPFYLRPRFSLTGMRSLLTFGGNITASRLLWFFFTQIDVIIVGKLLGKEMLGFYSVSMQLASLPVQRVSSIVNQVAFPVFSKIQNDREQFRGFVLKAIRVLSLVAFPVLWGISSIADELVLVILGPKWETAVLPLQLLTLMMPFRMIAYFLPSATDALGRPDIGLKNVLLASAVMPITFLFSVHWGIIGVTIMWVTVYPIILFINYQRSLHIINLQLRDLFFAIIPIVIITLLMYLAVRGMGWFIGDDSNKIIKLSILIATGILFYGTSTSIFNRHYYHEAINLFFKKHQ
ncbi:MAG TPA: hypothetical protein DEF07_07500 [Nitrosomonas sp.]|nr:hypothetical protein [Nitrosomonas sp.]